MREYEARRNRGCVGRPVGLEKAEWCVAVLEADASGGQLVDGDADVVCASPEIGRLRQPQKGRKGMRVK